MKSFEFKGDWEFVYQFEAFKGLQSRRGAYTSIDSEKESNGKVSVTISDEINDDTNPTEEQINSINFIIDNPDKIKQSLFNALEIKYPKLKEMYGYDENDEDSREWFPAINSIDFFDLKRTNFNKLEKRTANKAYKSCPAFAGHDLYTGHCSQFEKPRNQKNHKKLLPVMITFFIIEIIKNFN
ncbi:MAG: hypothetical protein AB8G22_27625 [Saprospiraceae bacterium]